MNITQLHLILGFVMQALIIVVCLLAIVAIFKNIQQANANQNAQRFPKLGKRTKKQWFNITGEYFAFLVVVVIFGICAFVIL